MGKSVTEQEMIYRAGLLHDVGKIRIPVDIINKPGKLTDEEYDLIKIHPVTGYHILKDISDHYDMATAAKYHHERYDGKGYPNGLLGENIPEMARILAIADSYDAMTSNRSYRNGLPQDVVRNEIEKGKGTQFDSTIADIMIQMIEESEQAELANQYDYYYVPSYFYNEEKLHEGAITEEELLNILKSIQKSL
jgi:HD-GYP domain-containing protein (c-di-GMP phosphodiesterase class II)